MFNAPRERVFRAFTDPTRLATWWGPKGCTNTFLDFDLRPGGAWRFVMHGPDGAEYRMVKEFVEVVAPERILLQHLAPMHRFQMLMTFTDVGGARTELAWRMRFASAAELERIRSLLADANEQNFDRLEAHLTRAAGPSESSPSGAAV